MIEIFLYETALYYVNKAYCVKTPETNVLAPLCPVHKDSINVPVHGQFNFRLLYTSILLRTRIVFHNGLCALQLFGSYYFADSRNMISSFKMLHINASIIIIVRNI